MKVSILATILVLGAGLPAHADVLLLDAIESVPPNAESGLPRPTTGVSMDRVEDRFGPPQSVLGAVGEPPITRWVYPGYTVYFEHRHVINVVIHR
jgi:hypothetical protein